MASHTLPTFANHLGTFTVVVTTDATATTPTINTITGLRRGSDSLEVIPGVIQPSRFTISVNDDDAGFWDTVRTGETSVLITLNPGGGDTLVYHGDLKASECRFQETANDGSTKRRRGEISLAPMLERLKDADVADYVTMMLAQAIQRDDDRYYVPFLGLFAGIMDAGFSQSYDTGHASVVKAGGEDWQFGDGVDVYDLEDLIFPIKDTVGTAIGYWLSGHADYLVDKFNTLYDVLIAFAANFHLFPEYDYDIAASKHKIKLLQAGRTYSSSLSLGNLYTSDYHGETYEKVKTAYVALASGRSYDWYYFSDGPYAGLYQRSPPTGVDPMLSVELLWVVDTATAEYYERLSALNVDVVVVITVVSVWNYSTGSATVISTGNGRFEKALLTYLAYRYRGTGQTTYTRRYLSMIPTGGTHASCALLAGVPVDGVDFDITALEKDYMSGEAVLTLMKI